LGNYVHFTAVVPSYNQGNFLDEALHSLINQGYPHLEIIVMDGGSADNSVEVIKRYESYLASWVSEPDGGQSDAISRGFAKGSGDWLLWLNSDDALLPGSLFYANKIIQQSNPDILSGSVCWCDEHSNIIRFVGSRPLWRNLSSQGIQTISQPGTFFRRSQYDEVGGLNLSLHVAMDTELWTRMIRADAKVTLVRRPLAFFRKHSTSKGATLDDLCKKESEDLYDAYSKSRWSRLLLTRLFQISLLFKCLYFKDIITTRKLRGVNINDVWAKSEFYEHFWDNESAKAY